jgi:hypothetical protein
MATEQKKQPRSDWSTIVFPKWYVPACWQIAKESVLKKKIDRLLLFQLDYDFTLL